MVRFGPISKLPRMVWKGCVLDYLIGLLVLQNEAAQCKMA